MKIIIQVTEKEYAEKRVQFRTVDFAQRTLREAADKFDGMMRGAGSIAAFNTDVRLEIKNDVCSDCKESDCPYKHL